jgi:hypothetical protein
VRISVVNIDGTNLLLRVNDITSKLLKTCKLFLSTISSKVNKLPATLTIKVQLPVVEDAEVRTMANAEESKTSSNNRAVDLQLGSLVHSSSRLIEDDEEGLVVEHTSDDNLLTLATRELALPCSNSIKTFSLVLDDVVNASLDADTKDSLINTTQLLLTNKLNVLDIKVRTTLNSQLIDMRISDLITETTADHVRLLRKEHESTIVTVGLDDGAGSKGPQTSEGTEE